MAIPATFLLFPSVGVTIPWQWTTEISGAADWLFPVVIFLLGSMLQLKYASRIWVVISFLIGFVIQALIRGLSPEINLFTALAPATEVLAAIFTFYIAPDPATSPSGRMAQILFGGSIAVGYMILMSLHVAFALFYSLPLVCLIRGVVLTIAYARNPAFGDVPNPEVAIPPQTFSGDPHSERKNPPPQASIGGPY